MRILMVCLGNICRSPIAEGVMQHKIQQHGLDWEVDSAGTERYHIGSQPHQYSQEICEQHGIDISGQKARQFHKNDFANYDKIYAMAEDVLEEIQYQGGAEVSNASLFLNELNPNENESVPDPYYGGQEGYTLVYDLIDRTCDAIIEKYKN